MNEERLFLAALDIPNRADRIAYLDKVCGRDQKLRRLLDELLEAHERSGKFLDVPVVGNPRAVIQTHMDQTLAFGGNRSEQALADTIKTHHSLADDDSVDLSFLSPSVRSDSCGRIGHYEVLEILGKGGFGIVFRAFDETLHRMVAIKVLSAQIAATSPARKRFLREARSSAKVRHENVVQVYAVEEQPLPYLVMEFIPGETIQQRIERTGPLEVAEVVHIGQQIAEGLAAAHSQGLIHRDIKPGNVLIEAGLRQQVKITDFGLARAADDASMSQSGTVAGTPMFMAPEQALGDSLDHRADLFSLGSVLYTMCTGRAPFRANGTLAVLKRVAEDTPRPIQEIIPEVPRWLCDIITRLHAKLPEDRIGSAREVADLLARGPASIQDPKDVPGTHEFAPATVDNNALEEEPPAPSAELPRTSSAKWPRFRPRHLVTAAAALLSLVGGIGFTEATGVTDVHGTVIRLLSPEGTLVIEVDDPGVSVQIDGADIVITGAGAKEIRLKPGVYTVEARKEGKFLKQELVSVTKNGRQFVRVTREPLSSGAKVIARSTDESVWERLVAALSADEQVRAVSARLKELNPGFDGTVQPTIENGVVRGLVLNSAELKDISPVRAFSHLRTLSCPGTDDYKSPLVDLSPLSGLPLINLVLGKSQLRDLSPLSGLPLTSLVIYGTLVEDLSPLKGMQLSLLKFPNNGKVSDLSPLKGMPLETLEITGKVSDLSPLEGMPLVTLSLNGLNMEDLKGIAALKLSKLQNLDISGTKISDLWPLKGMNLSALNVSLTQVSDLTPLKGMKLEWLQCSGTNVSDLSALNGMPLKDLVLGATKVSDSSLAQIKDCKELGLLVLFDTQVTDAGLTHLKSFKKLKALQLWGAKVSDLSPLKEMSLESIVLTPNDITTEGLNVLRNMKSLQTIGPRPWNLWPAAEFWARYAKGEFKK